MVVVLFENPPSFIRKENFEIRGGVVRVGKLVCICIVFLQTIVASNYV